MKRFWGVLCAILLIFGSLAPANSAIINLEDIAKNLFYQNPKFNQQTSPAPKRFKTKRQLLRHNRQDRNANLYAASNVVTNGNFTNGLAAWTINNPGNFPSGITSIDIDGPGPLSASDAFFVKAGGGFGTSSVSISQKLTIPISGEYTLFANIASLYFPTDGKINNLSGGLITVALNGQAIDSFDFGEIARDIGEYATLNTSFLAASSGILDINFFRPFAVDINSPTNYLDNVSLALRNSAGTPVPEPATLLLLGCGLMTLVGFGRKKFNK